MGDFTGIGSVFEFGKEIIKRVIPDKVQQAEAEAKLLEMRQNGELEAIKASASVVIAEAQGESYLQKNWRPITMLSFVSIIVNNYIIYPYLSLFWHQAPMMEIPDNMWDLLQTGLGGYVVGRTAEKCVKAWRNPDLQK